MFVYIFILLFVIIYSGWTLGLLILCETMPDINDAKYITPYIPIMRLCIFINLVSDSIKNKQFDNIKAYLSHPQKNIVLLSYYTLMCNDIESIDSSILLSTVLSAQKYITQDRVNSSATKLVTKLLCKLPHKTKQTKQKDIIVTFSNNDIVFNGNNIPHCGRTYYNPVLFYELSSDADKSLDWIVWVLDTSLALMQYTSKAYENIHYPFHISSPGREEKDDKGLQQVFLPKISMKDNSAQIIYHEIKSDQIYAKFWNTMIEDRKSLNYIEKYNAEKKAQYITVEGQRLATIISILNSYTNQFDASDIQDIYLTLLQAILRMNNEWTKDSAYIYDFETKRDNKKLLDYHFKEYMKNNTIRSVSHRLPRKKLSIILLQDCIIEEEDAKTVTEALDNTKSRQAFVGAFKAIKSGNRNARIEVVIE